MIEIFDSYSVQSTYTTQQLFNLLAEKYNNFYNVVYDTNNPSNVTELWVNDSVYITIKNTYNYNIYHTNGAAMETLGIPNGRFSLIVTDDSVFVHSVDIGTSQGAPKWLVITPIKNDQGTIELGVLADGTSSTYFYLFSKSQGILLSTYNKNEEGVLRSSYYTVLAPIYSLSSPEYTDHCYQALISKPTDDGRIILNNKKYYIHDVIAIEYT